MPTFEEIEAKIIENRILANRQVNAMPAIQPTVPDTFTTIPQPSTTAVMPITQKKTGTLEPEDPVSAWAVLRNLGRSIGRLADPKTLSEGSRELLDQISQADPFSKKGRQKLNEIITQFGEPLRDWARVTNYMQSGRFLVEKPTPGIQQAFRNIGFDPLAGPATVGMVAGGASALSRLAGRAGSALGRGRLAPIAAGEPVVTPKPKLRITLRPKPITPKPTLRAIVEVKPKPKVTKEPWEITRKQHIEKIAGEEPLGVQVSEAQTRAWHSKHTEAVSGHVVSVERAVKQGKPVPAEVLKDYPRLTPKKLSAKAQQDAINAKFKAIDEQIIAIEEQKLKPTIRLSPAKMKALDAKITELGQQKLVSEAGQVYVPVEEVRAATNRALKALDLKTAPEAQTVKDLNAVRRGDIAEADVRVGFAKKEIHRVVINPKRREAITHAIEDPKLASGLSEIEKGVRNEVKRFYDEGFKVANDADVITSAVENYINHVWETKSPKRRLFSGKYISGKTPFAKQRKIPSIIEGEKLGLKAKTKDPGELMEIWSRSVHRAIANKRFLDNLKIASAEDGRLLIQPAQSAPADFVSYDHPSLRQYRWRGKEGKGAIFQTGVKVHPQIAGAMDVAFGQGWQPRGIMAQKVFNAYTKLDQAAKKSILTVSLFHYHALSESAIATGQSPWAFVRGAAKLANNEELVVRAKRSGLQVGGTPDVARQSLRFERVPILRETVGKIIEKNDEFLWDNVHAGHKIEAFDRLTRDALTNKKYSHLKPTEIDRTVSTFINDAFGGLDWEALGTSTKGQWIYQRSLLAPDWTRAQIRIFKGMFKLGQKGAPERLSGELYRAYWRRAITYNLGGANALNYVFTAWKAGDPNKGHFMIQNAPGHKFQMELPYNGEDGKPRWIQVGKQFMEPFRYIEDVIEGEPLRTIGHKVGPTTRIIISHAANQKWFAGPPIFQKKDSAMLKYLKRLGFTAESVVPIPGQQFIDVGKGWKDPMDAFISGLGFPVKKDFQRKKGLRP